MKNGHFILQFEVAVLDPAASPPTLTTVPLPPASSIGDLSISYGPNGVGTLVVTVGASSTTPSEIRGAMLPDAFDESWDWKSYRKSTDLEIDEGYLSFPQEIEFPTENHGIRRTAHLIYYPPTNKDYKPAEGELPPLLVKSHGGPTGAASSAFSLAIQYWTSRGVAVANCNIKRPLSPIFH